MNTNQALAEHVNIISFPPIGMEGAAGLVAPYVSLKHYSRATLVLIKAAGNAAEDPTITFDQATAVAGTGTKALTVVNRAHKKESVADLETVAAWTEVTQAVAATFVGNGDAEQVVLIDIRAEDLDVDNGFDCVRAVVADVGAVAQIGCMFWCLWGARYTPGLTPIAN